MGNTKRPVKRWAEPPGALTPQSATGNIQPEPDPPDPERDPDGDNERRETSDDEERLDQAPLQGANPNMSGPSVYVQSPRAMMTREAEVAVGYTAEEMTESMMDIHDRRLEKGKEVERGEASRAAQKTALVSDRETWNWNKNHVSLLKELSEGVMDLQKEFGSANE